jgi:ribonuclease P protein component
MSEGGSPVKNTLGVHERLKSKKHFAALFNQGRSIGKPPVTLIYKEVAFNQPVPVQTAFTVPKRKFKKATERNKLKRRMKEAFRQNKHGLYDTLTKNQKQLGMVFVYTGKEAVSYNVISEKIVLLLQEIQQQLSTPL